MYLTTTMESRTKAKDRLIIVDRAASSNEIIHVNGWWVTTDPGTGS